MEKTETAVEGHGGQWLEARAEHRGGCGRSSQASARRHDDGVEEKKTGRLMLPTERPTIRPDC